MVRQGVKTRGPRPRRNAGEKTSRPEAGPKGNVYRRSIHRQRPQFLETATRCLAGTDRLSRPGPPESAVERPWTSTRDRTPFRIPDRPALSPPVSFGIRGTGSATPSGSLLHYVYRSSAICPLLRPRMRGAGRPSDRSLQFHSWSFKQDQSGLPAVGTCERRRYEPVAKPGGKDVQNERQAGVPSDIVPTPRPL